MNDFEVECALQAIRFEIQDGLEANKDIWDIVQQVTDMVSEIHPLKLSNQLGLPVSKVSDII